MSIPPFLSRSPPPICETSDEEDDFGSFVVNNELAVEITHGGDILDVYDKKNIGSRCEDTTSDDSGLCMGSIGPTQSPCDSSPISSSYVQSSSVENGNCDKPDFAYPTPEALSLPEATFTKSSIESDLSYSECRDIAENSTSQFNGSLENGDHHSDLFCKSSPETLAKLSRSIIAENPATPVVTQSVNLISETDGGVAGHIPSQLKRDDCDEDSFIDKVDKFIENENIEFDEFRTFSSFTDFAGLEKSFNEEIAEDGTSDSVKCLETLPGDESLEDINYDCQKGSDELIDDLNLQDKLDKSAVDGSNEALSTDEVVWPSDLNETNDQTEHISPTLDELTFNASSSIISGTTLCSSGDAFEDEDDFAEFQSVEEQFTKSCISSACIDQAIWLQLWPEIAEGPSAMVQLQEELERSAIWVRLRHLDISPALSYQWSASVSNCKLLAALNIDSRNILLGPWNKYKFSGNGEFAPFDGIKTRSSCEKLDMTDLATMSKDPVPDAHFDWVGSGLVNPLDCVSTTLLDLQLLTFARAPPGKVVPSTLLMSSPGTKGLTDHLQSNESPKLSLKANDIVKNLPDFSFMKKPFIVFPKCST